MDYPSWQSATEPIGDYSPRRPALYRIIYNYRDDFESRYGELFEEKYGFLRDEVTDAFDRYLNCGILRHGAARACCPDCNHSVLIAFSCKRRGVCPSCAAKRAAIFAEHLQKNILLPHSHRNLVFSLPKRLRVYFRFDRLLFRYLYQAAWQTWREYVGEGTAAVLALHTSGDLLNWHPHVHALCLNGSVDEQNTFSELTRVDEELLCERFSDKVFNFLFELEPMKCTRCGGEMKIVAFIFNTQEIEKICSHLGYPSWRAPPPFAPQGVHLDSSFEFNQE